MWLVVLCGHLIFRTGFYAVRTPCQTIQTGSAAAVSIHRQKYEACGKPIAELKQNQNQLGPHRRLRQNTYCDHLGLISFVTEVPEPPSSSRTCLLRKTTRQVEMRRDGKAIIILTKLFQWLDTHCLGKNLPHDSSQVLFDFSNSNWIVLCLCELD